MWYISYIIHEFYDILQTFLLDVRKEIYQIFFILFVYPFHMFRRLVFLNVLCNGVATKINDTTKYVAQNIYQTFKY